jgi:hypothetical protein
VPRPLLAGALAAAGIACVPIATAGPGCVPVASTVILAGDLAETSGVAVSRAQVGLFWTHNDDGSGLFAIDGSGRVLVEHPVTPRLQDWEDIELAACPAGWCLYFADTGDNQERRAAGNLRILRVAEPASASRNDDDPLRAEVFPIRLPDGPRDIEALFVLPGERVHLVTKGRQHPLTVYRYPGPLRPDTVTLEEAQRLSPGPRALLSQVTGASASTDGSLVAIRTYESLQVYRVDPVGGTLAPLPNGLVNLRTLEEIQGEGVGLGPDGLVVLTSEGGPLGGPASMRLLRCQLGG